MPSDKSIGHRALILGALGEGTSSIVGLTMSKDIEATANALGAMGVRVDVNESAVRIHGVGLQGLKLPPGHIDCGNSGTTMRLLAGILSGQRWGTRLVGDASLSKRPMKRIIDPLRARGAHIRGTVRAESTELFAPLSVAPLAGSERLVGLEYDMPIASAQVKGALLLSGLYADGITALREPNLSRDHTERMLASLGVPIERLPSMVVLDTTEWNGRWDPFQWRLPGDLSAAAFLIAAVAHVPDSEIDIPDVGINPSRAGFLDAIRAMHARFSMTPREETVADEPTATLAVEHGTLTRGRIGGELTARMIDEVPAFAAIAARQKGRTEIRDADELRVKESDRIAATLAMLRAFGINAGEYEDGFWLEGKVGVRGATVQSHGDHRIAMAATAIALGAESESLIENVGCVETSFPAFAHVLRSLGADVIEEEVSG